MDPDDLWDFGTVRHITRPGTIRWANAKTENGLTLYPQPVSDLNNNHVLHHNNGVRPASASKSSLSMTLTVTTKAELPRPPAHPLAYQEQDQATIRTLRRERKGSYDSNQSLRPHFSRPPPFLPGRLHTIPMAPVPRPGHATWLSPMCPAFAHCTCACRCLADSSLSQEDMCEGTQLC